MLQEVCENALAVHDEDALSKVTLVQHEIDVCTKYYDTQVAEDLEADR